MAEFADWTQWKQRCAFLRCEEEAQSRLAAFAYVQFRNRAQKISGNVEVPSGRDCFHHLEVHCSTHLPGDPGKGATYKEWIFKRLETHREGGALSVVETGASLLIRDVVRELAAREGRRWGWMDDDTGPSGSWMAPEGDLEAILLVYQEAADELAEHVFPGLPDSLRISALIHALELPLTNPAVWAAAGWGRAQLYEFRCQLREAIGKEIEPRIPTDGPGGRELLGEMVRQALGYLAMAPARKEVPESPGRRLLSLAQGLP